MENSKDYGLMQEGPGKEAALVAGIEVETEGIQEEASIGAAFEDPAKAEKEESVQKDLEGLEKESQEPTAEMNIFPL